MKFFNPFGFLTHNQIAVAIEERAGNYEFMAVDRIKKVRRQDGVDCYHFWRSGETIPVSDLQHVFKMQKGNGIIYYCPNKGEYLPCSLEKSGINRDDIKLTPKAESVRMWRWQAQRDKEKRWQKKNWMERYMVPIVILMVGMSSFLSVWQAGKNQSETDKHLVAMEQQYTQNLILQKEIAQLYHDVMTSSGITIKNLNDGTIPPPPK